MLFNRIESPSSRDQRIHLFPPSHSTAFPERTKNPRQSALGLWKLAAGTVQSSGLRQIRRPLVCFRLGQVAACVQPHARFPYRAPPPRGCNSPLSRAPSRKARVFSEPRRLNRRDFAVSRPREFHRRAAFASKTGSRRTRPRASANPFAVGTNAESSAA